MLRCLHQPAAQLLALAAGQDLHAHDLARAGVSEKTQRHPVARKLHLGLIRAQHQRLMFAAAFFWRAIAASPISRTLERISTCVMGTAKPFITTATSR